ncbi:sensor histidine kinase [Faecalimonas sp.]
MFKIVKEKLSGHLLLQYVVASILSWMVFFVVSFMISDILSKWVFNSELFTPFWENQCESFIQELNDLVEEKNMTVEEVREYNLSESRNGSVKFYSYIDYLKELNGRATNAQIVCSDGMFYPKKYVPSDKYWKYWNCVGVIIAFIFSEFIVLRFVYKLIRRMKILYNQINSTDLKKRDLGIIVEGRDELSLLGEKVETMRIMLVKSINDEMNQRQQQTKLIASLSHDIRTPLTKIITCLDILNYKLAKSEEERENCLVMITSKANQLKCLTDRLLNSVTCGDENIDYQREMYDGPSMLSQLLFEGSYYLEEEGFVVHVPKTISGVYQLRVDIVAIRRVADNVYSNIQKYADKKTPIEIKIEEQDKEIIVYVQNRKKASSNQIKPESHEIGLAIITQIMEAMGGRSEVENTNEFFVIRLILPKYNYVTDTN